METQTNGRRLLKHLDFIIADFILLELSFLIAYLLRFDRGIRIFWRYNNVYRHQALLLVLCLIVCILTANPYKNILKRSKTREIYAVLAQTITMMVLDIICLFFIHEAGAMSRYLIAMNWGLYFAFALVFRTLWKLLLQKRFAASGAKNAMIVLTRAGNMRGLVRNLQINPLREFFISALFLTDYHAVYDAVRRKLDETGEKPQLFDIREGRLYYENIPVMGSDQELILYATHNWVDEAFIDLEENKQMAEDIAAEFDKMGITTHIALAKLRPGNKNVSARYVKRISDYAVASQSMRIVPYSQILFKRLMDIAGGLVGCLLTGIIYIFVAPAIKRKSPGPAFFAQTRVGRNGKPFKMYKFRSMYMDAEERKAQLMKQNKIEDGMMFKMDDDPRIIGSEKKDKNGKPAGIGNFIRNTSLDEFPQFWNVLKGDMSLVGTRPPTMDEWEKYDPHHRARMSIRPGITGMWQISGRSNIVDFEKVVELDKQYIQNWTVALDIQILAKTVITVLKHEGAE